MPFQNIKDDVKLGENVRIFDFVNLYGCTIGDNSKVGAFVEIQKNATIGKNCKISSHTFICEGVTIEDNVFIGHNVSFINDKFPRATHGGPPADRSRLERGTDAGQAGRFDRHRAARSLRTSRSARTPSSAPAASSPRTCPDNVVAAGNPCRVLRPLGPGQ